MSLNTHDKIATWKSTFGTADITVKSQIGGNYRTQQEAHKAAVKAGAQAVITQENDGRYQAYKIDDGAHFDDLEIGEKVSLTASGKAAGVVDFVGDDGGTVWQGQELKAPLGRDNGKVVYWMSGFKKGLERAFMGAPGRMMADDELTTLRLKGYTVVVDRTATRKDMLNAFYSDTTAGVVYDGHGGDGDISTYEGWLSAEDIDSSKVSPNLKMYYSFACNNAQKKTEWTKALNGAAFYGWERSSNMLDAVLTNSPLVSPLGSAYYLAKGRTLTQAFGNNL